MAADIAPETTVVALIDKAAAATPDALAVHAGDGTLTYDDLLTRAELLAGRLGALGVGPGDLVALCVERSANLVVGGLGILKAGAAYVAVDPRYPEERIQWMLDDARARAVVCDESTLTSVGDGCGPKVIVLTRAGMLRHGSQAEMPLRAGAGSPLPSDAAYVVYTSGSTGQPKGVLVEHASLSNLIGWHIDAFGVVPEDRCTQIASPGFDATIWEVWPTLAAGASLHIVPDHLRADPLGLREWLVGKGVTLTFLPTAVAEGIVRLGWPADTALRYLLTGGDALTHRPPPTLPFTLVNNYGLSETAVVATSGPVDPEGEGPPSIGTPIRGVVIDVVDEDLEAVEPGEAGELLIGGVALARGYLNRPELNAQRFVDRVDGRRYRTGDVVRQRPDGELDFLGRLDDQLSIRGFRVEPSEVAAALNAHPAIDASVIVGLGTTSAERQLVAYVVPSGDERPERRELNAFLHRTLPEYLLPSRYVWIDDLPLTAHGKVDRSALPAPAESAAEAPASPAAKVLARTPTEATIAAVLSELLEIDEIGVDENFFLLGGHSMLGAQLIVRLETLFDVEISLRYLFDHPTLGDIAAAVDRQLAGSNPGHVSP